MSSSVLHEVVIPTVIYNTGKQSSKKNSSTDSPISIMNVFRMRLHENHYNGAHEVYWQHCITGFSEELIKKYDACAHHRLLHRPIGAERASAFQQLLQMNQLKCLTWEPPSQQHSSKSGQCSFSCLSKLFPVLGTRNSASTPTLVFIQTLRHIPTSIHSPKLPTSESTADDLPTRRSQLEGHPACGRRVVALLGAGCH